MVDYSPDQKRAVEAVCEWWGETRAGAAGAPFRLGGLAGTGKSTIAATLRDALGIGGGRGIAYVAPTGKAATVLRGKLRAARALRREDTVTTVHKLIYSPRPVHCADCPARSDSGEHCHTHRIRARCGCATTFGLLANVSGGPRPALVICDEASMMTERMDADLRSFGLPVLYVGDHGQLPPVGDNTGLMEYPDVRLEKIHRQAEGSGILRLAYEVRRTGVLRRQEFDGEVGVYRGRRLRLERSIDWDDSSGLTLCYTNESRQRYNGYVREALGYRGEPRHGERVICLRNEWDQGIYNGLVGTVLQYEPKPNGLAAIAVEHDDGVFTGLAWADQFGNKQTLSGVPRGFALWDFAYALTVHKSQGSEADSVLLMAERGNMGPANWKRWLYTGITRARKELTVLVPDR